MTAPERRRPLPALVFIGALSLLTALVWFRVLHRTDSTPQAGSSTTACPSPSHSPSASSSAPPAPPTTLPVPAKVTVLVLNSTNRNGVAGAATKLLRKDGFATKKATNDQPVYGGHGQLKTYGEIRYAAAQLPSATLLSYYFPRATLVVDKSAGRTIYVALGQKFKHVAPAKTVRKALKRDQVTLKHRRVQVKVPKTAKPTCS